MPVILTPSTTDSPPIDILDAAAGPKRMRTDEGSVEERSIADLILANNYAAQSAAAAGPPWGIRMATGKPRGTVV